jgi:rare lipoprotein A
MLIVLTYVAYLAPGCSAQSDSRPVSAGTSASEQGTTGTSGVSKETQTGEASFIASSLNGRKTANGKLFDGTKLVAAHPSYPIGTILRVTNEDNGRVVEVTVVDRTGPPSARRDRMIDLSRAAAERLDFVTQGTARVTTEVLQWGDRESQR